MKRNKVNTSKAGRSLASVASVGVLIALVISMLLSALVSTLVLNGSLQGDSMRVSVFVIRTISLLLGALISGVILKKNFLPLVGIVAGGYLLALIGIGIAFYNGDFLHFLSGVASVLIGGMVALLILQKPKRSKRKPVKYNI